MSAQPTASPVRLPTAPARFSTTDEQQFRRAVEQSMTSIAQVANSPPMEVVAGQVPTSHTDPRGAVGEIVTDGAYIYFKVAASLWGRVTLNLTF